MTELIKPSDTTGLHKLFGIPERDERRRDGGAGTVYEPWPVCRGSSVSTVSRRVGSEVASNLQRGMSRPVSAIAPGAVATQFEPTPAPTPPNSGRATSRRASLLVSDPQARRDFLTQQRK